MLGTLIALLLILAGSALVGQAIVALGGRREWSHLSPAIGLGALLALAWGTVRLPGEGTSALIALALALLAAAAYLRGGLVALAPGLARAAPLALAGTVLAALPFIVEMRFGILGTGLNPDMSQHLFAAERLAAGGSERLIAEGYPLGPHALVVAISALGPSLVHGFDGLMIATAVATCLAALAALETPGRLGWPVAGSLVVGFAYLLASNYIQGAFKEAIEALFVLAFAVGLAELARGWGEGAPRARLLGGLPLAAIALGALYAYSFPGLLWIAGALLAWAAAELTLAALRDSPAAARARARAAVPVTLLAIGALIVLALPEAGRIASFASFETFDPKSAGLGNLFDRLSPLEALGIWPSGDFRVEPGDGAAPAIVFYLGAALGAAALAHGLRRSPRRGEHVLPAALLVAAALWVYAYAAGTPYQEAKALVIAAPLVALISVRGLLSAAPSWIAAAFLAAAGGSGLLALVNGPVGPGSYSTALAELRAGLPDGSVLISAPAEALADQHARDYLVWELRGNRICVVGEGEVAPEGEIAALLEVELRDGALVPGQLSVSPHAAGPGPCPFITDGARADPAGDD